MPSSDSSDLQPLVGSSITPGGDRRNLAFAAVGGFAPFVLRATSSLAIVPQNALAMIATLADSAASSSIPREFLAFGRAAVNPNRDNCDNALADFCRTIGLDEAEFLRELRSAPPAQRELVGLALGLLSYGVYLAAPAPDGNLVK